MSTSNTEDMRQHFEPDGSPARPQHGDAGAHCAQASGSTALFNAAYIRGQEENRTLRIMCAIAHAGLALYTDDGELQDNREPPFIDWRRDDVDDIENKLHERFARRMRKETEARQGRSPAGDEQRRANDSI